MASQPAPAAAKARPRSDRLGRSAVTGKYVLRPASRPGLFTEEQIEEAVRAVIARRQAEERADQA